MGEALRPGPLVASAFVDRQAVFTACRTFRGAVDQYIYKLGADGLGYYRDDGAAVQEYIKMSEPCQEPALLAYLEGARVGGRTPPPTVISLVKLMQPLALLGKRLPRVRGKKRPRKNKYKCEQSGWLQSLVLGVGKADTTHRDIGLIAVDSYNGNSHSTELSYLQTTAADVVCIQETRALGAARTSFERAAKFSKWNLAAADAVPTAAGSTSAGVAVASRSHLGLADVPGTLDECKVLAGRFRLAHVGAGFKGGLFVASLYLWCSEGLSPRNLAVLEAAAKVLSVAILAQVRNIWLNFHP